MSNFVLKLENISKKINNSFILKDISFSLKKWDILSIIWKNWSWKSTLLKIIAWIYKEDSWYIYKNYKKLSYVPQKLEMDDTIPIKVKEFIKIYNKSIPYDSIFSYLEKFNAWYLLDKHLFNLSWWELQKVLIVSSIISNPDLILFDEPTSWIDIIWEDLFYKNIYDIKKEFPNISIILVSHNIKLVYKNSDYVVCLHKDNYCCHWKPSDISWNIKDIFWDFLAPYEHNPHTTHKN